MRYQLVLQWPASSIKDHGQLIEIEDMLIENISDKHEIDGHDVGSEEVNVFIQTNDPMSAFDEAKKILYDNASWIYVRAAFRELANSQYTILWPKGLSEFSVE